MAADVRPQRRSALVLYGSETGTAQELAEEMGRIAERLHFATRVAQLDDVGIDELLIYDVVLLSISTTGQGAFPSNATTFSKRIRSTRLRSGHLSDVLFTSFGLGDTSYPKFNFAHRKLYNRLIQLGATPFCERGESDEQHPDGVDGLFAVWAGKLKQSLLDKFPLSPGQAALSEDSFLEPTWALEPCEASNSVINGHHDYDLEHEQISNLDDIDHTIPVQQGFDATFQSSTRLTPENHWQDVRLFSLTASAVQYAPGDVLSVHPQNSQKDVLHFLRIMSWESLADSKLRFVPTSTAEPNEFYPPRPIAGREGSTTFTLRRLLTCYLDLNAVPRRSFFAAMAHFTDDETQKERLVEFASQEYIDEYYDYATRPRRGILEVLQEFDTVKIPLKWIASIMPKIRGRQFSIASGGVLKTPSEPADAGQGQTRFELLVAIVKYRTVIKRVREGLCTRYLASLKPGTRLTVVLTRGGMKVDLTRPSIMIGPGTGLAPLRSMMHERAMAHEIDASVVREQQLLFFGGRNRSADYFFEDEWHSLKKAFPLEVYTAFSRDQREKVYVQDVIRQNAQAVYPALQRGNVYLCGSSGKMPEAVREALIDVLQGQGKMDRDAAEAIFVQMEKSGRYQQETW